MALSEKASQALKGQADKLVAEIKRIEEPIERLIKERDALQKQIDEVEETSRDLKEAANILMDLAGEEKPYELPKWKEVVDYLKPGRLRVKKICDVCGETVYVPNSKKKCPLEGCNGRLQKPEPKEDPDHDDDKEPDRSDPPTPADEEEWRRPGPNRIKKGCRRCKRAVYVLPHCTICPDEVCRGNLVDAKK